MLLKGEKTTKGETCNVEYCITTNGETFVEKPQLQVTFMVFKTKQIIMKIGGKSKRKMLLFYVRRHFILFTYKINPFMYNLIMQLL